MILEGFENTLTSTALADALVSSRLDYCNSLLASVPATYLKKLQRVQNSLARVVTLSPKLTSSQPLLNSLHWLPIKSRIHFKLATITYKCIHQNQPPSLSKLIKTRDLNRSLRSQTGLFLNHSSNKSFGRRSFTFLSPVVWNKIPPAIRLSPSLSVLRRKLKTHYFSSPPNFLTFPI